MLKELELNQIWREYSNKDYGDIIRWKITQLNGRVAIAQNQATLKEMIINKDNIDTFTFQCFTD